MAKRKPSRWSCDLCGIAFDYPSKYRRHIESSSHKRFAESCLCVSTNPILPDAIDLEEPDLGTGSYNGGAEYTNDSYQVY